jgi:hypothetical protein
MGSSNVPPNQKTSAPLFAPPLAEARTALSMPWIIAGAVVLLVVGALFFADRKHPIPSPNTVRALDPYAAQVVFSGLEMSESTSLSGGKSTYIDGHVQNKGPQTLTGAIVQVIFANDMQLPPQVETLPLTLIRTRQPYVDTQPLRAAPIPPGQDREFRLIFENIGTNWNGQIPEIHLVQATPR